MKESIICLFVSFQVQVNAENWSELKTVEEGYWKLSGCIQVELSPDNMVSIFISSIRRHKRI